MNSKHTLIKSLLLFLALLPSLAPAAVVLISYTGSTTNTAITGSTTAFTFQATYDNGGSSSIINRNFDQSHFVSATLTSGTYTANYDSNAFFEFHTGATGEFTGTFIGTYFGSSATDSLGGVSPVAMDADGIGGFNSSQGGTNSFSPSSIDAFISNSSAGWSIQPGSVPEPSRALLLMGGVLGVVLRRRRGV